MDISPNGKVLVSASGKSVLAHDMTSGLLLWNIKPVEIPNQNGYVGSLRVCRNAVVVTIDRFKTVVLDIETGIIISLHPNAGLDVMALCVFERLYL